MIIKRLMRASSAGATKPDRRRWRFRFVDLLVSMCLRFILWRLSFPDAVTLKVFRALRCDFILGICSLCVMLLWSL
jgi:hypothetical protein